MSKKIHYKCGCVSRPGWNKGWDHVCKDHYVQGRR